MSVRPRDKRVAAYAVAMTIGTAEIEWDDLDSIAEHLRSSKGLSVAGLWAVVDAIRPFVRLGHGSGVGGAALPSAETGAPPTDAPPGGPPPTMPSPARPGRIDLKQWALQKIERTTGKRPERVGRGQTYAGPNGRMFHLRSMHPFARAGGRSSYWFGLAESCWNEADVFVLVCGTDGILVVPVADWSQYQAGIAQGGPDGTDRQPSIWLSDGHFELRTQGRHIDATPWLDRFDLL